MKKILLLIMLSLLSIPAFASPYAYINASYGIAYNTNVFSSPLPDWDEDDMNFDYERRVSTLLSLDADVFFNEGPAGLSVKAVMGVPVFSEKASYDGSGYIWEGSDAISSLSFSIGPVFRYRDYRLSVYHFLFDIFRSAFCNACTSFLGRNIN